MELSYWEYKDWLSDVDFTIIGSGITGLNCALRLKERFPGSKVVILERGSLPQGASTKNAGFACFGSISEILDDLQRHSEQEVTELVQKRYSGIEMLRRTLGDEAIGYHNFGGHELFPASDKLLYEQCRESMGQVNELLTPVFRGPAFTETANVFGFRKVGDNYITHTYEGQIDTGKMMRSLLYKVQAAGVLILNAINVESFEGLPGRVEVKTNQFHFSTGHLLVATNGFASRWFPEELRPARAQVLITKPIADLKIRGTFHLDKGYYYFRDIDGRILLGGGRNLDFKGEETSEFGQTAIIQEKLETLLTETILPGISYEIDRRWSGIMGVGPKKSPVVRQVSERIYCGVRLGGMGIAIGSLVGAELADLVPA
ncbi:NAD(P)/FAD-dependent oxidoreductase [Zeaxanthinibacter enoshimensis]|uniref:Glycine/D-amino acid oxidase-like deaminating enzyme n=1 Tax=Zeaxanthinibacter enoshimensis TaxID=392009 RepID=A0A4V3D439_9FLAO|nr:FAD-dependent oxidoreductase [Zeaxanthinibacter enoshimensis]TDQ32891.1 glycine/D-amino acid oxidase-like deaminating enzyme [Zeaxanthinibacter enoshimensis]